MKYHLLLIQFLLAVTSCSLAAQTQISCTHPELCKLAAQIGSGAGMKDTTYKPLIKISGDPHEFELSMADVKNLINAPILIVGPRELNPWMTKVNYQRSKNKNLKTLTLTLPKNASDFYPGGSQEALSHFWLYPRIYCQVKMELQAEMLAKKLIQKTISMVSCENEAGLIENKLKKTFAQITMPVILTHDAIEPLLLAVKSKQSQIVAIKGSGHHDEASTDAVKKLYAALKAPVAIWIEEEGIHVPHNILSKKRKQDLTLKIGTDFSATDASFTILESLNEAISKLTGQKK